MIWFAISGVIFFSFLFIRYELLRVYPLIDFWFDLVMWNSVIPVSACFLYQNSKTVKLNHEYSGHDSPCLGDMYLWLYIIPSSLVADPGQNDLNSLSFTCKIWVNSKTLPFYEVAPPPRKVVSFPHQLPDSPEKPRVLAISQNTTSLSCNSGAQVLNQILNSNSAESTSTWFFPMSCIGW